MYDPNSLGMPGTMVFFWGIVEDRRDPMHLGRIRVRAHGFHNPNKNELPVSGLPWAAVVLPVTSASNSGIGSAPIGPIEGTTVFGFFRDGLKGQEPVVLGTLPGIPNSKVKNTEGFNDPFGVYPKEIDKVSTNKLAYGGGFETGQIHQLKDANRDLSVEKANTTETWDQPPSPYQGQYPFNHVFQSEAGTVIEIDSSQESERFHLYMANGTFIEIDDNGQMVINVTDDEFHINERSINMHIMGHQNITIDGDASLYIKNAYQVQIDGNANIVCKNDVNLTVHGDMSTNVRGTYKLKADTIQLEAGTVHETYGTLNQSVSGTANLLHETLKHSINGRSDYRWAGDKYSWIGADTYNTHDAGTDFSCPVDPVRDGGEDCTTAEGSASSTATNLPAVDDRAIPVPVVQKDNAIFTHNDVEAVYNEPTKKIDTTKAPIEDGASVPDLSNVPKTRETPKVEPAVGSSFPKTYQLSEHFILGDLTSPKGGGNPEHFLRSQHGLSEAQIVTNLKNLCANVLEPIVEKWGLKNLKILSGFRNGASSSKHERGEAVDIRFNSCNRDEYPQRCQELAELLQEGEGFDGILLEYASNATGPWIHIGYYTSSPDNANPVTQTYVNHKAVSSGFVSRG